jgi:hypothetical protein
VQMEDEEEEEEEEESVVTVLCPAKIMRKRN